MTAASLPSTNTERDQLQAFIESEGLKPKFLLNTHCHLDHIFGNGFVSRTYDVPLIIHEGELEWIEHFPERAAFFLLHDMDNLSPAQSIQRTSEASR